jgi:hypothetical protein
MGGCCKGDDSKAIHKGMIMTKRELLVELSGDEELLFADGFDDAIIGFDRNSFRVIYSVTKAVAILEREMGANDAIEYFEYNVESAYVGEKTPIWCQDEIEI